MDTPKLDRQLRLMMLLTENREYTVAELAMQLETSARSVYRYLEAFRNSALFHVSVNNDRYRLDKDSPFFKTITQLVHFTDDEVDVLKNLVENLAGNSVQEQNLRRKLYRLYDYNILSDIGIRDGVGHNTSLLYQAIKEQRQAILQGYNSVHSHQVSDRLVEPFAFAGNNKEVWCYELSTGINKLFKVSRISTVQLLESQWKYITMHCQIHNDLFHFSSPQRTPVTLRLGWMATDLLLEEYPEAQNQLTREDENHWILHTEVCSFMGIGRFVLGLFEDIEIIDSPELSRYLQDKQHLLTNRMKH